MIPVLLIDDKKEITNLLHKKLLLCGIQSDTASNFKECKDIFDTGQRYKVVVADYNLNNGASGLNIIQMYNSIDPSVFSILYSSQDISDTLPMDCVDKVIRKAGSAQDLINLIMSVCAENMQPSVLEKLFEMMTRLEQKVSGFEMHNEKIFKFMGITENFMAKYEKRAKTDFIKIVLALGAFVTALTAIANWLPMRH